MTDLTNLLAPTSAMADSLADPYVASSVSPAVVAAFAGKTQRLLAALEGVLALHKESRRHVEPWARGYKFSGDHCAHDGDHWPCPTVAAVVAALGEDEKPFTGFPPSPLRKNKVG